MLPTKTTLLLDGLLALDGLGSPIGRLAIAIVAIAIIIIVGKIVLNIAWRILTIAAVIVGIWYLLTFFSII
jgi:hypothetical protein